MTDVVLISLEAWDEVWRRNQHLIAGLLRTGRVDRVLFVEPPRDVLHDVRRRRHPQLGAPGPREVHLPGVGPRRLWTWRPYKALPRRMDPGGDSRRARRLGAVARRLGMSDPILWVNDPDGAGVLVRRRVRAQIAISRYVAKAVDGEATVIYPGVPVVDVAPGPRRPAVLVVQRLQPEKRTDIALRAFAAADPAGWTLDIIGRGPEEPALRALARRLGVADRVRFLGFRDDVSEQMSGAGVLLAPCDVEGLGLSVLEAMAHALPVVASRAGAHGETVGSVAGARLHDPEDWEMAGRLLAELVADAGEREDYGARLADAQRARFTPEAQVAGTDAVYRKVMG